MMTIAQPAHAGICSARSGEATTPLVELYTSEGCSSCPPADSWLATRGAVAPNFVALAFHVDYWDYLGWRDPYAQGLFSARQRSRAQAGDTASVYTPQVMVGKQTGVRWYRARDFEAALALVHAQPARADLSVAATLNADQVRVDVHAQLRDTGGALGSEVYVVAYQSGLSTAVRAGENAGSQLTHDFVVRELQGPFALAGDGSLRLQQVLPHYASGGIVAFVQSHSDGDILQALALPLAGCVEP